MKKSLLALAVVAVAASANAATVYDKDGTSLQVNGRVQSVYYSNNFNSAGTNDSSIQNSARLGLAGKTQITDWVSGLGVALWDMNSTGNDDGTVKAREQYVGADFGEFGVLTAGKFRDASYYAEAVTDNYEDCAGTVQGNFNGSRRAGQLMYTYDNYGFHGQFGVQTAQNDVKLFESDKTGRFNGIIDAGRTGRFDVDSGFSAALGYTFDDVVFGPLSLRTGYSYVKGQNKDDVKNNTFDKFKHANAGISWGNLASGLYFGALYDYGKAEGISTAAAYALNDGFVDNDLKIRGFELTGGYAFDNGISFLIGYESAKYTVERPGVDDVDFKVKRIPVFVKYQANANFNVWAEAGFNAGSDHAPEGGVPAIAKKIDHQLFAVGARYTF